MNYKKKTILDVELKGKKVLCRCDCNVPTNDEGVITDDSRIRKTLPTIQYLLDHGAAVILCSHKGRPKNGYEEKYSLKVVQARLSELLGQPVALASDIVGPEAQEFSRRSSCSGAPCPCHDRWDRGSLPPCRCRRSGYR